MKIRYSAVTGMLMLVLGATGAIAAEPFMDKTNLFTAHEGGYDVYRIPSMVVTHKGTILAFCEARELPKDRTGADWAKIDILMRRSTDGGESWEAPRKTVEPPKYSTGCATTDFSMQVGRSSFKRCLFN